MVVKASMVLVFLKELKPFEVEVAAGEEDKADFLGAGDWGDFEGLFLVTVGVRELN